MLLPLSLIQSFLELKVPLSQIAEALTLLGIEVDRIYHEHPSFGGIVVGEILSVHPHPQADKLVVTEVSDGKKTFSVVCGAPNCRAGMKTAYAKVGALITDSDGLQRHIEKATIRGVESHGMLCSAAELHFSEDHEGILDLPSEMGAGTDLTSLLWDPVFELSLTPNLGHCFSALGIARELSAAFQEPLSLPKILKKSPPRKKVQVSVADPEHCLRYAAQLIEGIEIAPSPFWLQKVLKAAGMKPINSIVDITNYILLKFGQPLHAFDADRVEGALHVQCAKEPFSFMGLDEVERNVPAGTLLISDTKKPLALAGILGGLNSAVSGKTERILLEAAHFNPTTIRIASKQLSLRTESAIRFEKGVDPNGIDIALNEACALILEICGGKRVGAVDQKKSDFPQKSILCRTDRVNQILGTKISLTEMKEIFYRLQFKTRSANPSTLRVEIPSFRFDLGEEIDLIEEIARIYGYNNIEKGSALCAISPLPNDPTYLFEEEMRKTCIGLGLQEFLTSDLIGPKLANAALEIASPQVSLLKALHAKTEEYSILRPSLLPSILQVVQGNLDRKNASLAAFEIGRIHFLQKEKLVELPMAALVLTGNRRPPHWDEKPSEVDFYDLKGLLESLFEAMKIPAPIFQPGTHISFHPSRQANLLCGDLRVGSFGEIHPALLAKFDIKQRVLFAEIDMEHLIKLQKKTLRMRPLSQFPASERDWTIPLPLDTLIQPLFESIQMFSSPLLEKAELIDLYHPEDATQKNATFRFTYRDPLKTISFEEVEKEHSKLTSHVLNLLAK